MKSRSDEPLGHFTSTNWSQVSLLQASDQVLRRRGLSALLDWLRPPLRAHLVWRWALDRHTAEDFLQGFIADKILERDLLGKVDRSRGRLRSFVLASLDNYVRDHLRVATGGSSLIAEALADSDVASQPATNRAPSPFDVLWAHSVFVWVLRRMCVESAQRDGLRQWSVFDGRILRPALRGEPAVGYPELVRALGLESESQAANILVNAKKHFQQALRTVVAESLGPDATSPNDVAAEISELKRILAEPGTLDKTIYSELAQLVLEEAAEFGPLGAHLHNQLLAGTAFVSFEYASLWLPEDYGVALAQELDARIEDLGSLSSVATSLREARSQSRLELRSLCDLLTHPHPRLELLTWVKQVYRDKLRSPEAMIPEPVASCVYYAAIAAALQCHGKCITTQSDQRLHDRLQQMASAQWVPEWLAIQFRRAATRVPRAGRSEPGRDSAG